MESELGRRVSWSRWDLIFKEPRLASCIWVLEYFNTNIFFFWTFLKISSGESPASKLESSDSVHKSNEVPIKNKRGLQKQKGLSWWLFLLTGVLWNGICVSSSPERKSNNLGMLEAIFSEKEEIMKVYALFLVLMRSKELALIEKKNLIAFKWLLYFWFKIVKRKFVSTYLVNYFCGMSKILKVLQNFVPWRVISVG